MEILYQGAGKMDNIDDIIEKVSWKEYEQEAISLLSELIKIPTVNPPGNELKLAEFIGEYLKKSHIKYEILESTENRGNIIGEIKGTGEAEPLLFHTHLDTVPVEDESKWRYPPFSGQVVDNKFIWGRGAVDVKGLIAQILICFKILKDLNLKLKRKLIFVGACDEERGGKWGSEWLVKNHPDKLRAEYAFGEVGGYSSSFGKKRIYSIEVAQKGTCRLRLLFKSKGGHGSIPIPDNPIAKAGKIAWYLSNKGLPLHPLDVTKTFFQRLSSVLPFPQNIIVKLIPNPYIGKFILNTLLKKNPKSHVFKAMLSNTATPTIIRGGEVINIIPEEVVLELDGRTLPDLKQSVFLEEIKNLVGEDVKISIINESIPLKSPLKSYALECIERSITRFDPEATVIPYLLPAFTDAKNYSKLGIKCYGFFPIKLESDLEFYQLFHSIDERIPIDGYLWGIKVMLYFMLLMSM